MYTDCQLKDFKLNSDLMKSMILGFVLFLKIVLTAHLQNGTWNSSESIVARKDMWVFKLEGMQM